MALKEQRKFLHTCSFFPIFLHDCILSVVRNCLMRISEKKIIKYLQQKEMNILETRTSFVNLTIGLSGSLGSVMTKFFSMRSRVVARSMPLLISFFLSSSSKLSGLSSSLSINRDSSIGTSSSCFSTFKWPKPISLQTQIWLNDYHFIPLKLSRDKVIVFFVTESSNTPMILNIRLVTLTIYPKRLSGDKWWLTIIVERNSYSIVGRPVTTD